MHRKVGKIPAERKLYAPMEKWRRYTLIKRVVNSTCRSATHRLIKRYAGLKIRDICSKTVVADS